MKRYCGTCKHLDMNRVSGCELSTRECLAYSPDQTLRYKLWEPQNAVQCKTCRHFDPTSTTSCFKDMAICLSQTDKSSSMYSLWEPVTDEWVEPVYNEEQVPHEEAQYYSYQVTKVDGGYRVDVPGSNDDDVNHPNHYTSGQIEVIDFLEDQDLDFRLANVIKYLCRYRYKGTPEKDLRKAQWYLHRFIKQTYGSD